MKHLITPALAMAAMIFANPTYAVPVQYQFTATQHTEFVDVRNPLPVSDYLIADGAAISATFFYDADIPATLVNDTTLLSSSAYGLASIYSGAVTHFSGAVAGHVFSFDSGITIVTNSVAGGSSLVDGVFNAGILNIQPGYPATVNFQGFSVGDFTLLASSVYSLGFSEFLTDQSLPAQLVNGPLATTIHLTFHDEQNNSRSVDFQGLNITAVPIPAASVLFMSGLFGLVAAARKHPTGLKA